MYMSYEYNEELNRAKTTIMNLMKKKYTENIGEYNHENNENINENMNNIIKVLHTSNSYIFQMITFTKEISKGSNAFIFRTDSSYNQFVQYTFSLRTNFENINKYIDKIMSNIGYVTPENM